MIFVTSGTQLPFDRFVEAVDEVAAENLSKTFLVQATCVNYQVKSRNIQLVQHLSPVEFTESVSKAELIISHAGIGSIVSAAQAGKSLIVFPRLGKLKEHRNNHQVATCEAMQRCFPLHVATNSKELGNLVNEHFQQPLSLFPAITAFAPDELLNSIRKFIEPEPVLSLAS